MQPELSWIDPLLLFFTNEMFVWGFSSHSRMFHSYGDVTMTGEGLQILTYTRHLWPLSNEGSLVSLDCYINSLQVLYR